MIEGRVELNLDIVESATQRGIDGGVTGKHGGDAGPEEAVIEAGKEQSGTQTSLCGAVAKAFGQALDHAVEAESAELIGDSALADHIGRTAGEIGEMLAQIATAEAVREQAKEYKSVPQRRGTRIGKSQTGGTLASIDNGAVDGQDGVFGENAIVTDTLDLRRQIDDALERLVRAELMYRRGRHLMRNTASSTRWRRMYPHLKRFFQTVDARPAVSSARAVGKGALEAMPPIALMIQLRKESFD